jgi:hypothetical protein
MERKQKTGAWLWLRVCLLVALATAAMDATRRTTRSLERWRHRAPRTAPLPLVSIRALGRGPLACAKRCDLASDLPHFWVEARNGATILVVDLPEEEQPSRYQFSLQARHDDCIRRWVAPTETGWRQIRILETPEKASKDPYRRRFRARIPIDDAALGVLPGMSDLLTLTVTVCSNPLGAHQGHVVMYTHMLTLPKPGTRRARALGIRTCSATDLARSQSPTP